MSGSALKSCLRPSLLGLCFSEPTHTLRVLVGRAASGRRCWTLVPPCLSQIPSGIRWQIGSLALSEGMAPYCLCLSQMPSFAILLVRCREHRMVRGSLFRSGIWRLRGSWGVSRAPCAPQHWPIVYIDIASDSHRASGHMNAICTCGREANERGCFQNSLLLSSQSHLSFAIPSFESGSHIAQAGLNLLCSGGWL